MKLLNSINVPATSPRTHLTHDNTIHQQWPEVKPIVTTAVAAKMLNRSPQTLRKWACYENGPLRPLRINGRLAWPVDAIAALVKGNQGTQPLQGPSTEGD